MSVVVEVRNRQRSWRVDRVRVGAFSESLLRDSLGLGEATLGIHLVGARAMAAMNWRWLRHEGSTDILTFDHRERSDAPLHGELWISVDDAVRQSVDFGVTADEELARYVIHGILHLLGYDDLEPASRRVMKRVENRWVRRLAGKGQVSGWVGRKECPRQRVSRKAGQGGEKSKRKPGRDRE